MGKTKIDIKGKSCGSLEILFYMGGEKKERKKDFWLSLPSEKVSQLPYTKFHLL